MLVGVDGSSSSTEALAWASDLTRRLGDRRLLVANVLTLEPSDTDDWTRAHKRASERLDDWCLPLRQAGTTYASTVLEGHAGPALLAAAQEADVELIVVGSRSRRGMDAWLAGSVMDYLAHRTSRPLVVVPPGDHREGFDHIVVGLDGSEGGTAAAHWAGRLATSLGARVTAVYVRKPPNDFGEREHPVDALHVLRTVWAEPIRAHGVEPDCEVVEDEDPSSALLEYATGAATDLLVLGTRATKVWRHLRVGGVTMHALHHGSVPILVVPPAAWPAA